MHTRVLTVGAENAAPAAAAGPSAGTSGSPFPPPKRGERSKRAPQTVGPGFGFASPRGAGSGTARSAGHAQDSSGNRRCGSRTCTERCEPRPRREGRARLAGLPGRGRGKQARRELGAARGRSQPAVVGRADPCGERARERRVPAALTEPGRRGGGGRCAALSRGPLPWPPGLRSSLAGAAALTAAWPPWRGGGACDPGLADAPAATAPAGGAAARACALGRPCRCPVHPGPPRPLRPAQPRACAVPCACRPCPAEGAPTCACVVGHLAGTRPAPGHLAVRACALPCASAYVRQGARGGGTERAGRRPLRGTTALVRFRRVRSFTPGNWTLAVLPFPVTHCLTVGSRHSWHRGKRFFASGQALGRDRRRGGGEEPSGIQPSGPASSLQEKAACPG
ncbi:uncharacterized protein LOC118146164 [Callithrix jacchus]